MIIERIRLKNIKTYTDTEIVLHAGVNFIKGRNGAGKSTLIECIGYALFNYAEAKSVNEDFLTYGKNDGLIEIDFTGTGQKKYTVVRTVSIKQNRRSWLVYEKGSDTPLDLYFEEDKQAFLAETMGLDRERDPSWIFKDIIGVRQGAFREPFEKPQEERKRYFNRIFGVEDYNRAHAMLLDVNNLIGHRTELVSKDMEYLSAAAAGIGEKLKEEEQLALSAAETAKQLQALSAKLKENETQWTRQKQLKDQKNSAEKQTLASEQKIQSLEAQGAEKERQKAFALAAQEKQKNHEKGYHEYKALKLVLEALDKKSAAKKEIQLQLADVEGQVKKLDAQINAEIKNLEQNEAAIQKEKEELGQALNIHKNKLETLDMLLADHTAKEQRLEAFNKNIGKSENYIEKGRKFIDKNLAAQVSRFERLKAQLEESGKEAQRYNEMLAKEQQLAEIKRKREELLHVKTALAEKLRAFEQYEDNLAQGVCPFFEGECVAAKTNGRDGLCRQKQMVLSEIDDNKKNILSAEEQIKELLQYEGAQIKYATAYEHIENLQKELQACEGDLKALATTPSSWDMAEKAGALKEEYRLVTSEEPPQDDLARLFADYLQALPSAPYEAALKYKLAFETFSGIIKDLKENAGAFSRVQLAASGQIKADIAESKANLQTSENRLKALEEQGRMLNDTRAAIKNLHHQKENAVMGRQKVTEALKEYDGLEENLEQKKKEMTQKEEDYKTYIQNADEAQKLVEINTSLEKTAAAVSEEKRLLEELKTQFKALAKGCDETLEQALQEAVTALNREKGQLETKIEHNKVEMQRLSTEIDQKKEAQRKLDEQRRRRELLDEAAQIIKNTRTAMKTAGPKIAGIFRSRIQARADGIYRSVSKEGVNLLWPENYEIELHDMWKGQERKRTFKQLSGGEKMTAALAVRLSLLEEFSSAKIGFFDEPTDNMDVGRKEHLADILSVLCASFHQVFVISHDDTFDKLTDNVICLNPGPDGTSVLS